jgi:glycosyltransferase involved in cell wall biosynthesis
LKLLFTQDALVNAGAERSHLEILSRFSPDTEAAMVYFYPKQELKSEYEKAGVRLIFLDIPETYHFPLAISRLVRLIRTEKPDLLISCLWRADIITRMASVLTGVPLIGTLVNDSYSPIAWKDKKGLKYKVVYWLDRLTAGIPRHWIANAQALADSHVQTLGLKRDRISVVYRGRRVMARDVIAREARPKQSSTDETASAAEDLSEKVGSTESSLAVTKNVIASAAKQSPADQTALSAESSDVKSELSDSSLAVTRDVIAREARPASPELDSGKQSPTDKTASAAEDLSEKAGSIESSLAVTSDVIASAAKQSPADKTASSAESSEVKSELSDSSLAVTGDVIAGNVIAREARPKQSFTTKQSLADKTASADGDLLEKEGSIESSLAVTGVTKHFISYGRLLERKGFQEAIEAFSQVIKTYPDCTLTIFGEGPFRKNLETQIQHLGLSHSVFLPGKLTNPMDALIHGYFPNSASTSFTKASDHCLPTTANCFLFPSWYEGFSGALVEAMMAGIPIIASDIPMNLEAVTDRKTALTFSVGKSQDLADKMVFALEHPEQMAAMGQEARREAEERFDIEKIAKEYERVVRSLSPPRPFPQELRDRLP